jgi:hypothetical protein
METTVVLFLLILATLSSVLDLSSQGKFKSEKLNMKDTWQNKWKNGNVKEGEKFFLSSTSLVFLTDFFHFVKFLYMTCLSILVTVSLTLPFYYSFGFYALYGLTFEIFYRLFGTKRS